MGLMGLREAESRWEKIPDRTNKILKTKCSFWGHE